MEFSFTYEEFTEKEQLSEADKSLIEQAEIARNLAYAPYSKFYVGAAVLLDNNRIILGNNQENAAYPDGLCAERVAIFSAMANFPTLKVLKIAIVAGKDNFNENATAPCGSCRQAILEYEVKQNTPIEILFMGTTGKVIKIFSIKDLLPLAFSSAFL